MGAGGEGGGTRLTQEAHWFLTRKSGKTWELGGAVDFTEVGFLGDVNGQAHLHQLQRTEPDSLHPRVCHASRSHVLQPLGGKFRMTRKD